MWSFSLDGFVLSLSLHLNPTGLSGLMLMLLLNLSNEIIIVVSFNLNAIVT